MITEMDLQEAIAECQGKRNPNADTCIKLAAFYIIKARRIHMHWVKVLMPILKKSCMRVKRISRGLHKRGLNMK